MSKRISHIPSKARVGQSLLVPVILGFVLLGAFLFLAGCAQPPVPQDRDYRIEAPAPSNGGLLLPGTVEVDRFGAEGLASGAPSSSLMKPTAIPCRNTTTTSGTSRPATCCETPLSTTFAIPTLRTILSRRKCAPMPIFC